MNSDITLIITMFNRLQVLRNILLSVSIQTVKPVRIIIADDGSQDDPAEILQEFAPLLSIPILHVRQENDGFRAARSRNNGIRASDDGILVFADQDVLFTPRYFETIQANMRQGQFLVGFLLRLDETQTKAVTGPMIRSGDYSELITKKQVERVQRQYRKEKIYAWLHRFRLRAIGPKLRSGVFGIYKSDISKVNGFDEAYKGWGHEDDDLGWRLYAAGVTGNNVFDQEYSLHQYHPPHRTPGVRVNQEYFYEKKSAARKGMFRCEFGIENAHDDYADVKCKEYTP